MQKKEVNLRQFKDKTSLSKFLLTNGICKNSKEVNTWIKKNIPLETYYQEKVIEYMSKNVDCFYWKAQAWGYGRGGIPDVCCIIKGLFYGFEIKRPVVGIPSALQLQVKREIEEVGGKVYFVTWVDEVKDILDRTGE